MRLRKEDYQQKRLPQEFVELELQPQPVIESDADLLTENNFGSASETGPAKAPNKLGLDLNGRKMLVSLAIIAFMFVIPAVVINNSTSILGLPSKPAFSEAVVEPEGQVAGVSIDLGDSVTAAEADTNEIDANGQVQGISTADASNLNNASSQITLFGLPVGTAMIAIGLLLVMIPVVVLLRS